MKKVRICSILTVLVVFITSIDTVHAFDIEAIMTASDIVDGKPQGKEIYFEPGDSVWIYICTINHPEDYPMNMDVKSVLHDPLGQVRGEIFYKLVDHEYESTVPSILWRHYLPSWAPSEYEGNVLSIYWKHYLPSWAPLGKYTVSVTIHDRNDDTEKTVDLTIHVGSYKAYKYLEKANLYFMNRRYEKAKEFYKMAEDKYEQFAEKEKIEECKKYILAEDHYLTANKYVEERNYEEAINYFARARDLYKELGNEALAQTCDSQIEEYKGIRLILKELFGIPFAINLSLITWMVYILLIEFRRVKKKETFVIFAFVFMIISILFVIGFHFYNVFYTTILLAIIIVALTLRIVFKNYKRKMYTNPYIAGNPIRSREMFFGRKDVFDFIRGKLSAKKDITIVLYGERRTGKTSVLYQIENGELGTEFIPVYTDIQEMAKVNEPEFFIKITERITESLMKNEIVDLKSSSYSEVSELIKEYRSKSNTYQVFNKFLDKISDLLQEKYLILMFDEYEILEKKIEEGHLSPDLIHYLRSQIQSREKFSFIFAGSKKLEELGGKHWSLMFNAATYKKISFLNREDALNLMTIPVRNRIHYDDEAIDRILRLTACHPYFLQFFLQNLVDHLNDSKKNTVTAKEVNYIVTYLLDNPSPHMIYIWQDSTDEQKLVLSVLSGTIESEKEYIPVEEIKQKLTGSKASDVDSIKKALNELYQKEILDCRENSYNFRIDLLKYWIKTEHPLFRTMEEIQ